MESIVNYESDDENLKLINKSKSNDLEKKKRRYSSDNDSSSSSDSSHERSQKIKNEEEKKSARRHSPSPSRKSSHKSSRSSHKSHDSSRYDRRRRSSSKDSDKYERKRRDDRDDKKKRRRERDWSTSNDRVSGKSRQRERERSSERRKDKYDDRERYSWNNDDDRRKRDDYRSSSSNDARSNTSASSSNSSSAIRRAEALGRAIERRANEKKLQLQKLGIEIPTIMQQLKPPNQQSSQIRPLMSISTGIPGSVPLNTAVPPTTAVGAAATNDETKAETDNLSVNLSNFTSSVLTNAKYTEQMQKKKLIWGAKKAGPEVVTNNKWEAAKFSQDTDGKVASKFLRLMGMKNAPATATATPETDDSSVEKREKMFSTMEQQYEIARQVTHTMRGVGLGFGSQSRPC